MILYSGQLGFSGTVLARCSESNYVSFRSWWSCCSIRLQGSPAAILLGLPSLPLLEYIWKDYMLNFRAFGEQHARQRKKILKLRREQCTKWLYTSLRHEAAQLLDTLKHEDTGFLLDVDIQDGFVRVPHTMTVRNAEDIIGEAKATLLDARVDLESHEVKYWARFETDRLLVPGLKIVRRTVLAGVPEIHAELKALWISRWQQLSSVPAGAWDRIMALTTVSLPQKTLQYTPFFVGCNVDLYTLSSGGGLKTRGPDAWSKDDLKALPKLFLADLVAMYQKIENGMDWPEQLTWGHVTALAKKQDAEMEQDFRPVTLYSLLYRLRGSCRFRDLLAQMNSWMFLVS